MLGTFEFHIYVLARHSSADMSELATRLRRDPTHLSTKGLQVVTPSGRWLPWTARDSKCLIEVASDRDGTVAEGLEVAADILTDHQDYVRQVADMGGTVEVFVRWYPNGDTGDVIDAAVLQKFGALGVKLGFNVYGVPPAVPSRRL